ncbi:FAD-binding oxidoreductase [Luteithermobacter gelatinilyticus]|uniref:FAD-binding oxidoreductase n=1 Tax=Luteithermobacter gelatinilyticus TaxID=2582913 RepID=UPI001AF003ED|nr:FAD-binding oxidoreductase [Luteithermobacter gelatinilyticus]
MDHDFSILREKLTNILGGDNLITDARECAYYSQDVYSEAPYVTKAVLRPANIGELSAAVRAVTAARFALFPRGGGMSYTSGYLPSRERAVTLDLTRMDRILEINLQDMYITVEAGCRWVDIYQALKDKGVRPPFWGTLSGLYATVGGGVSQNSIFFGTGLYGTAADSVIGLQVVGADGEIIRTGSAAVKGGTEFFRHYGPDLTGIFTGDTGALGIKAILTLKLIANPPHRCFGSFCFDRYEDMLPVMSEISRCGLASECFGFDPYLQKQRMKRESLSRDLKNLGGVMRASGGVIEAFKRGSKLAMAGRRYMKDVNFSFHVTTENRHKAAAEGDLELIRKIVTGAGGQEIENSIPTLINANPFMPVNNMIGPEGERWVPVHAVVPHSRAVTLMRAMEDLFCNHAGKIEQYGIGIGYLLTTIGQSAVLLEPVFFWPDALKEFHRRHVEKQVLKTIKEFPENLKIREFVQQVRQQLTQLCLDHAAVHFQIGRTYLYSEGLDLGSLDLVRSIKRHMDPYGLINPGALGLAGSKGPAGNGSTPGE